MKSQFNKMGLIVAAACLVLGGCAGRPITLNSFPAADIVPTSGRPISAKACGFQLLYFIPININTRLDQAYSGLQNQAGRDKIANLSIEESWTYGFVGTAYCTRLEAVAYQSSASQ